MAGFSGAFIVAFASGVALPFCGGWEDRAWWVAGMTVWGGLGSLADSVLGGLFQASVVDKRSGKIVEGTGGMKVLIHPGSTRPGSRGGDVSLEDKVQLRNTEAVVNTATLRGSRATGEAKGSQPGRAEGHESRRVESGCDILDNNAVNVLMAGMMSLGAMGIAWFW